MSDSRDFIIEKNSGMDPMMGVMMSMLNKDNGGLGGNSAVLILLLLLCGRGGLGGLGGFGAGAGVAAGVAAAGVTNCQDYLALLNAIAGTKEAINTTSTNTNNKVDLVGDRVIASSIANAANINSRIDSTNSMLSGFQAESSNRFFAGQTQVASGFNETQRQLDAMSAATNLGLCKGFSDIKENICSSSAMINTNINNVFNALTSQNATTMNVITSLDCKLTNQNEKLAGLISSSVKDILCGQERIIANQIDITQRTRIQELEERNRSLECQNNNERINHLIVNCGNGKGNGNS